VYSYVCYGLAIRSTLPLPELEQGTKEQSAKRKARRAGSGEGAPDVNIRFGKVDRLPSKVAVEGNYFRAISEETQLFWEGVGTIQVRGGREITIDPVPGVQEDLLRHLILGPALAALLQQRGLLVLHASAVVMDDGTVVFLGGKGWGKSSLAGALYARGYGIAADDVAAVHVGKGRPRVIPAFPQLKLWPDTAASLGNVADSLPELYSGAVKLAQRVDRGFPQTPLPLKCIYVLAQGKTKQIEPLAPGKAFLELVRHSYWAELLQASGASSHFLQCASVSKNTMARYLRMPRSLAQLPDVVRMVEEDITTYDVYRNSSSSPAA
jgi:hypothetical protein